MLYLYHVNILTYHEVVDLATIGRTTGEIICADDGRMSGKHAQVSVEMVGSQQIIYIEDLGSKNHTAVNRTEIPPHQKLKIKMYFLLEIGDQKFVLTDSKTVNMQDMNEMIDRHMKRTLVKLEPDEAVPAAASPSIPKETTPFEQMQLKEAKILQLQKDVTTLELNAKSELMKLDEAKEKVIVNAKAKKGELSRQMLVLKAEVEESKAQMAKIKLDLETKKKKIINLKDLPDLPSDSTEELPE